MWWVRLGFYLLFALYFSWVWRQGSIFFGDLGLYQQLPTEYWLLPAIIGFLCSLFGLSLHLAGRPNLIALLGALAVFAYFGIESGHYHTQCFYFFGCLVIITLPVAIWQKSASPGENTFRSLPFFLFLSYFYARVAFQKWHAFWWLGGSAMESLANFPIIVTSLGKVVFSQSWAQPWLAPAVVLTETLLGVGIFCSIFSRTVRWVTAIGMVLLHTQLLLLTDIGYFPLFSLLAAVAMFPVKANSVPKNKVSQIKVLLLVWVFVALPLAFHSYDSRSWLKWDLISYPRSTLLDMKFFGSKEQLTPLVQFSRLPHSFSMSGEFAGPLWHFYFMEYSLMQGWLEEGSQTFPMNRLVHYLCRRNNLDFIYATAVVLPLSSPREVNFSFPCR